MIKKIISHSRSTLQRQIAIIVFALIFTVIAFVISLHTSTTVPCEPMQPDNSISVFKQENIRTHDCYLEDNIVYRQGDDPYIVIKGITGTTQTLTLVMSTNFANETICVVYYPNSTTYKKYSDDKCVQLLAGTDTNTLIFEIPSGEYSELRLDVDYSYQIQDILVSPDAPKTSYNLKQNLTLGTYLFVFVVILLFIELNIYVLSVHDFLKRGLNLLRSKLWIALFTIIFTLVVEACCSLFKINLNVSYKLLIAGVVFIILSTIKGVLSLPRRSLTKVPLHDGLLSLLCFFTLYIFIIFFTEEIISTGKHPVLANVFYVGSTVVLIAAFVIYYKYVLSNQSVNYCNLYTFIIAAVGIMYLTLFLPMTAPDEFTHFTTAYRFSNLFCLKYSQLSDSYVVMRQEDATLYTQYVKHLSYDYYRFALDNLRLFVRDPSPIMIPCNTGANALLGYLFSGFGIAIARLLNLSGLLTYYSGRFFNLVLFILCVRYAFKKLPFGKTAVFAFSLFPMVLELVCSYSYDGPIISITLLFITQILYLTFGKPSNVVREFVYCVIFAMILASAKLVYAPIILLIFIVPNKRLNKTVKTAVLMKFGLILCSAIFAVIISKIISMCGSDNAMKVLSANGSFSSSYEETCYSISWIIHHIPNVIDMYLRTLINKGDFYILTMVGNNLGWLDISVPNVICMFFMIIFLLSCMEKTSIQFSNEYRIISVRLLCGIIIAGIVCLSMFALMLAWTPSSATIIYGVQGRYFLPCALLLIFILGNNTIVVQRNIRKYAVLLCFSMNFYIIISTFFASI